MKSTVLTIPGNSARVTLTEAKGFSEKDMLKIKQALCVLSYVINHNQFWGRVIHYYDSKSGNCFTSTTDLRVEVYHNFIHANENGNTGDDNELDFSLQYYNSWWSRVVGYTLPKSLWIWMNWKYHLRFKPWETAGNLGHEQCHKIGYDHKSATEYTSVPYAIGFIIKELGEMYYEEAMKLMDKIEITTVGAK